MYIVHAQTYILRKLEFPLFPLLVSQGLIGRSLPYDKKTGYFDMTCIRIVLLLYLPLVIMGNLWSLGENVFIKDYFPHERDEGIAFADRHKVTSPGMSYICGLLPAVAHELERFR